MNGDSKAISFPTAGPFQTSSNSTDYAKDATEAAAQAVKAGTDLECGVGL